MSRHWPKLRLGEIVSPAERAEAPVPGQTYRQIGVRLWGEGAYEREPIDGADTKYARLFRAETGDIVVNKIWARNGSVAVVTDALSGTYGSSEFPMFAPHRDRVESRWLRWLTKTPGFWAQCDESSRGTSGKNRIRPEQFLQIEIPLPPLAEQRRIVARIEELTAQIHEAHKLREESSREASALIQSVLHDHFSRRSASWCSLPIGDVIEIKDKLVDPTLPAYRHLPHLSGENMESGTCRLLPWRTAEQDGVRSNNYLFGPGTILYSKIRPYLRKAVIADFGGVCSADVYPIRVTNNELDPTFVMWSLVAEPFTAHANRLSGRTRMPKLNRKQLFDFRLAYPSLAEQRRIVAELDALQAEVDALKRHQRDTAAELDALLPAILDRAFRGEL